MREFTNIDISISLSGDVKESAAAQRLEELHPKEQSLAAKRHWFAELWPLALAASLFREHDWLQALEFKIEMNFQMETSNHWSPRVTGNAYVLDVRHKSPAPAMHPVGAPLLHQDDVERLYLRLFGHSIYSLPRVWTRVIKRTEFGHVLDVPRLKASMLWAHLNPPPPTAKIIQFTGAASAKTKGA